MSNKSGKKPNRFMIQLTAALCIAVVLFVALWHIDAVWSAVSAFFGFFSTVILGGVIAYVIDPLCVLFEKHVFKKMKGPKIRRNLSVLCGLLVVGVGIALLMVALIPQLINSVITFVGNLDSYAQTLQTLIMTVSKDHANIDLTGLADASDRIVDTITEFVRKNQDTVVSTSVGIGSGVVGFIIAVIIAIYILLDKQLVVGGFKRLFKVALDEESYGNFRDFWSRCNHIMVRFIAFDLLDGLFVGVVNAIFMIIAGFPYVDLVSVVVGVTNLAPTFGPLVGAIIGAFILVLVNPWYALAFIIFTLCLQTFDGYIFKPQLFGDTFGVPSLMILIAIVVGGKMFGVAGILLAIPVAAILDFIYQDWLLPLLQAQKEARVKKKQRETGE